MGKDSGLVEITPRPLSGDEYLLIGQIVRVSADLEDCLNLWICKLGRTDEAASAVLLGRSNIATKLLIAEGLAALHGSDALELHKSTFDSRITQLLSCRNALAHGAFAGETDDGCLAFVTNINAGYQEAELRRRADVFSRQTLGVIANSAWALVRNLDDLLGLGELRNKRQWHQAPVRPEHQPKGKHRGAQEHRPRSTQV